MSPNVYFSVGESIAALGLIILIHDFLRPLYKFRLEARWLKEKYLYCASFFAAALPMVGALVGNLDTRLPYPLSRPVFWELGGGLVFFGTLLLLAVSTLTPAKPARGGHPRFCRAVAKFLAGARRAEKAEFAADLRKSIRSLLLTSQDVERLEERSAFEEFRLRTRIINGNYAHWTFDVLRELELCEALVGESSVYTSHIIREISKHHFTPSAEGFVEELARQAVSSSTSMLSRETSGQAFRAFGLLSHALFEDYRISGMYAPLSALRPDDIDKLDADGIERLMHAYRCTARTIIKQSDYWQAKSIFSLPEHVECAVRLAVRSAHCDDYSHRVAHICYEVASIAKELRDRLEQEKQDTVDHLYMSDGAVPPCLVGIVAEAVVSLLRGLSSGCHTTWRYHVHDGAGTLLDAVYPRDARLNGMDPLQQKVAANLVRSVEENMKGFDAPVTRLLLRWLGAYDPPPGGERVARAILSKAIYIELKKFPALFEAKPELANRLLPSGVQYERDNQNLAFPGSGVCLYSIEGDSVSLVDVERSGPQPA